MEKELGPFQSPVYVACFQWLESSGQGPTSEAASTSSQPKRGPTSEAPKSQTQAATSRATAVQQRLSTTASPPSHRMGRNASLKQLQEAEAAMTRPITPLEARNMGSHLDGGFSMNLGSPPPPLWIDDDPAYGSP